MEILHEVIEIGLLLAMVVGAVLAYFRFRGRKFGLTDLLIFGMLAILADIVAYKLFLAMVGSHADSAAYGSLAAMLLLFGLASVVAGLNIIAIAAMVVCLGRYPAPAMWCWLLCLPPGWRTAFWRIGMPCRNLAAP